MIVSGGRLSRANSSPAEMPKKTAAKLAADACALVCGNAACGKTLAPPMLKCSKCKAEAYCCKPRGRPGTSTTAARRGRPSARRGGRGARAEAAETPQLDFFRDCNSLLYKLQDLSAARDREGLVALEDQATQIARLEVGSVVRGLRYENPANAGAIYYNLALAHEKLRNFERSVDFYEQDLALAKSVGDSVWKSRAEQNINMRVPWASATENYTTEDYERM